MQYRFGSSRHSPEAIYAATSLQWLGVSIADLQRLGITSACVALTRREEAMVRNMLERDSIRATSSGSGGGGLGSGVYGELQRMSALGAKVRG